MLAFRTTLALGYLRAGDPTAAVGVYDKLDIDWAKVRPGWQAVHAAALGQAGQAALARSFVRQIKLRGLKNEERVLIQPYIPSEPSGQ
jgi:hypothetical protein